MVVGSARDYLESHPKSALLVVEVADTSLSIDQTTKAGIYARARIPEDGVRRSRTGPGSPTGCPGHRLSTSIRLVRR